MSDLQTQNTTPTPAQPENLTDGMHVLVEALKRNGIETIYGLVGIPVTDFAREAQKQGIKFIGFRHEQSDRRASCRERVSSPV